MTVHPNCLKGLLTTTSVLAVCLFLATPSHAEHGHYLNDTAESATSRTLMASQQINQTSQTVGAAFDRLAFLNVAPPSDKKGVSSGESAMGINLWINPYYTYIHDTNVSTGYNGDTFGAFMGGDYQINSKLTAGLMLGVDHTSIDSKVNGGGSDTVGITVAPYARYSLNNTYSADVTFGYTNSNSDSERVLTGTRIDSSGDTDRVFGSVGVNGNFWHNRWNFVPRVGTTLAEDDRGSFTESNGTVVAGAHSTFGQAQIGMTTSYYFEKVRPWFSATYAYDYKREVAEVAVSQVKPSSDRDQVVLGVGATVFGYGAITGDVSVKQTVFKDNYDNTTVGFTVSATF